ncbi:MAG: hypothetical protein PHO08_04810 [Methylococcales bacterium]|nr:hypothetical protein [Methylococcales bacterium]MDD5632260.1 hypothetical protein [Methylococcales bacterium]
MKTILALIGLGLLAISGTVFAEDGKTFPGSMCQPVSGEAVRFFINGTVNTDSTFGHFVNCPVVRDTIAGAGISSASITVRDPSPDEDVECTFKSLRADGIIVASSSRNTSGVNTAPQTLQFGSLSSVSGGNYVIQCRIPKANGLFGFSFSEIISYRVNEN